jgi:redox-sensitive bicupin YhaK (pirin superfamily)
MGFGMHPHDNMEIITIPLEGDLAHKDSMGNAETIKNGEIQVMSAGTGVRHSEFNPNENQPTKLLQIWLFPNKRDVTPRYDQILLNKEDRINTLQQIVSPSPDDAGTWIHQDAWFHVGEFTQDTTLDYRIKKAGNGAYIFVIKGDITIDDQVLHTRDGYGIWDTEGFTIKASEGSELLIMDIPMEITI